MFVDDKPKGLDAYECDNFPYDDVIASYEALKEVNSHTYERLNLFLLELIAAYDKEPEGVKKSKMYDTALSISDYLLQKDAPAFYMQNVINRYQILKRHPGLTEQNKEELKKLQIENKENVEFSYAIALLLDNKSSSDFYWNQLDSEVQQLYNEYFPISVFKL